MQVEEFEFSDGCFLREQPIKTPEAVIEEFYEVHPLEEVKIMIWKLFKAAMTSKTEVFKLDKDIGDILFFIENFIMLHKAAFELTQRLKAPD